MGCLFTSLFFITGACLVWVKDIRHHQQWIGGLPHSNNFLIVRLLEPLVEKQNSFKALGEVQGIISGEKKQKTKGKVIIYFKKDSLVQQLDYGCQIVFKKPLQEIKNSGNPGSFNYKQYCLFQGITYQVYLNAGELVILPEKNKKKI